jgi:hypothetical protein
MSDDQAEPSIEEKKPEPIHKTQSPLALNSETGVMIAKDSAELWRQVKILFDGNAFPKTFKTIPQCIAGWNLASSFGPTISPQRAVSRMMMINDTISIWGELPRALAEATKEVKDFEIFLVDSKQDRICFENKNLQADPYAAICNVQRKGRTKNQYSFTTDDAEKAGLLKKTGPWQQYAKIMMLWKVQGMAWKFDFGDALMGCEIAEYTFNRFNGEEKDVSNVTNTPGVADELNKYIENQT